MKKQMQASSPFSEFKSIKELMQFVCSKYAKKIAFTTKQKFPDKRVEYTDISFTQLYNDIERLKTAVNAQNVEGRAAIIGRNSYEWAIAHLSNLFGNRVSVPLDKDLQLDELESSLIRSESTIMFFDIKYLDKIEAIKAKGTTGVKLFICMSECEGYLDIPALVSQVNSETSATSTASAASTSDVTLTDAPQSSQNTPDKEMGILLFTSGTTAQSKAVMLSQYGIVCNIRDLLLVEMFASDDVNIALLPFHHIFGSTCLLVMLSAGVKTVFCDGLRYVQQNLKEYKVSVFVGVPALIDKMYESIEKGIARQKKTTMVKIAIGVSNLLLKLKIDVRKKLFKVILDELGGAMRFVISGGAPLHEKTARRFNELGIIMVQGYGLTETSPVLASENPSAIRYGSIGHEMNSVCVDFVDVDENGIGEIRAKGPNVMLGYYKDPEATERVLRDGWFYTGDLGYRDKDGFIFITGRKKDVIVLKNGKNVFPEELEMLVNRIDEVEECMVFGRPDENDANDMRVMVKVVVNKTNAQELHGEVNLDELNDVIWSKIKEINKNLPRYKYMKGMILTDVPLIKTTTNKVKRNEEMKLLMNG